MPTDMTVHRYPKPQAAIDERPQAVIVRMRNVLYHVGINGMLNTPPWLDRTYGNRSHRKHDMIAR